MKKIMRDIVIMAMGANLSLFAMAYSMGDTDSALVMLGSTALLGVGLAFGSIAAEEDEG